MYKKQINAGKSAIENLKNQYPEVYNKIKKFKDPDSLIIPLAEILNSKIHNTKILQDTLKDMLLGLITKNSQRHILAKEINDPEKYKTLLNYIFLRQVQDIIFYINGEYSPEKKVSMDNFDPITHSDLPKPINEKTTDPTERKYLKKALEALKKGEVVIFKPYAGNATGFGGMAKAIFEFAPNNMTYLNYQAGQDQNLENQINTELPVIIATGDHKNSDEIKTAVNENELLKAKLDSEKLLFLTQFNTLMYEKNDNGQIVVKKKDEQYVYKPGGHWDFKIGLWAISHQLKAKGIKYFFFSNCDNIGAKFTIGKFASFLYAQDEAAKKGKQLVIQNEAAPRAPGDAKGGCFLEDKSTKQIKLIEGAMLSTDSDKKEHGNTSVYNTFNPNSLIHETDKYFGKLTNIYDLFSITPPTMNRWDAAKNEYFSERAISQSVNSVKNNEAAKLIQVGDDAFAPAKFVFEAAMNQNMMADMVEIDAFNYLPVRNRADFPLHNIDKKFIPTPEVFNSIFPNGVLNIEVKKLSSLIFKAPDRGTFKDRLIINAEKQVRIGGDNNISIDKNGKVEIGPEAVISDANITVEKNGKLIIHKGGKLRGDLYVKKGTVTEILAKDPK